MALPKGQRRHFMITLWPSVEVLSKEIIEGMKIGCAAFPDIQYIVYQWERTKEGKLHGQMYLEHKRSVRASVIQKLVMNLPFIRACDIQFRKYARIKCKLYCSKASKREADTEYIEIGQWRELPNESKPKKLETVMDKIINECESLEKTFGKGYELDYIAAEYPTYFLRYGERFEKLFARRSRYKIRKQFFAETEDDEEE